MTVKELIEKLSHFDPDDEVRIAQPTHCYWKRTLAANVRNVNIKEVEHSDYYSGDILKDYETDESREVVLIE